MIYDSVIATINLHIDLVENSSSVVLMLAFTKLDCAHSDTIDLDWGMGEISSFCDRVQIELPESYFEIQDVRRDVEVSCNIDDHIYNVSDGEEPVYKIQGELEILSTGVIYDIINKAFNTYIGERTIRDRYVGLLGFPIS